MLLRDFQNTGSSFLQANKVALYLDDAGLGKSATALDAADKLDLRRILILGPAVAGVSWPIQVKTWSPSRRFVNLELGNNFGFDLPGVYFVSYDMLSQKKNAQLVDDLRMCPFWDGLILDEAQYLKNPGSNRTCAVYGDNDPLEGIAANALRVWVLSGTLAPNHAGELYSHMNALFQAELRTLFPSFPTQLDFEDKFCRVRDTQYGRVIEGSKNQKMLRNALAPVTLRRRKADVMKELLPIEWFSAPIGLDADTVNELLAAAIPSGFVYTTADELADAIASNPNAASQRRELGLAKVPSCAKWVIDRLEAGEPKVIVFAHHTAVLEGLLAALFNYDPVFFAGNTTHEWRETAVRRFQNDPNCRVFVGQLQAAGTAITLTAAKCVFFAEYASTPGVNYQAASRAHRMGQRDGVQCCFGMVPNSLDERIAATAERRAREISELFD